jgi:hypothetical protein
MTSPATVPAGLAIVKAPAAALARPTDEADLAATGAACDGAMHPSATSINAMCMHAVCQEKVMYLMKKVSHPEHQRRNCIAR